MRLPHPFIAGASPFGYHLDTLKRLEDGGCAAVVLHSLFEEQVGLDMEGRVAHMNPDDERFDEMIGYFPPAKAYRYAPDDYAEYLHRVTQAVKIPVIGSLNGRTRESWLSFARMIEQAGAAALEVNWYQVHSDVRTPGASVEDELAEMVRDVKGILKIPVAVKVSPFFTAFANVAHQLDEAGADGLVLFNRFYQPDIDPLALETVPQLHLSDSSELLLRLRWLAILGGRVRGSLAVSGGVHEPVDAVKAIMAGADGVQIVSALLKRGPAYLRRIIAGFQAWAAEHEYDSLDQMRGSMSLARCPDPASFERGNYIRILQSWQRAPSTPSASSRETRHENGPSTHRLH
jgi:dihydroorotate dehydrogenase (fumarate)